MDSHKEVVDTAPALSSSAAVTTPALPSSAHINATSEPNAPHLAAASPVQPANPDGPPLGTTTPSNSDARFDMSENGSPTRSGVSKGGALDPHTLEWIQKRKADAEEAERLKTIEVASSLTPEEQVALIIPW